MPLRIVEVSPEIAVQTHRKTPYRILDGTWLLGQQEQARINFEKGPRIKGANFLDIDEIAATHESLSLPHMMPSTALHSAFMDFCGISATNQPILLYAQPESYYIHRAWYQLVAYGHDINKVHILTGTVQDWRGAGGNVDESPTTAVLAADLDTKSTNYPARSPHGGSVINLPEMKEIVARQASGGADANSHAYEPPLIVDARSADRFYARVEEPRRGLKLGHMPGATNLPFADLLDPAVRTRLKSASELRDLLTEAGIPVSSDTNARPVVATCGSGATACTVAAALSKVGVALDNVSIYDGSWMEWGAYNDTAIVTKD